MAQPTLLDFGEMLLTDDERGRIVYTPGFIDSATAAALFAEIRSAVQWQSDRRMMNDREEDVPRLTAHYRLDPASDSTPRVIQDAARRVGDRIGAPVNSVGLNLYRDGRDSVAPHNDHLNEIRKGFPIALVSLGATRRMTIRAKEPPHRLFHVDLEPGSLLVMDYTTQLHYTHGVPKTLEPVGERISLAFRVRPVRAVSEDRSGAGSYR